MAEYYGAVPVTGIDWNKTLSPVADQFNAADAARKLRKESYDKMMTDLKGKVNSWETTSNATINDLVLDGADQARNQMLQWNRDLKAGKMKPSEYREKINNLNDSWETLAYSAKTYDQRVQEAMQRQQPGENGEPAPASVIEMYMTQKFADINNTGGKNIVIGQDGNVYMVDINDPSMPLNVKTLANPGNMVVNRVDVPTAVQNTVKNWDQVTVQQLMSGGATSLTEDPRLNQAYKSAKYDLVSSLVDPNNPMGVASILLDNSDGEYRMYSSDAEKQSFINDAIRKEESVSGKTMSDDEKAAFAKKYEEEKMIRFVKDPSGNWVPVLTDAHVKAAEKVVDDQIEVQLGFKKTAEPGWKPATGGGGSTGGDDSDKKKRAMAGYKATLLAWGYDPESVRNNPNDPKSWKVVQPNFSGLSKEYQYVKVGNSVYVYEVGDVDVKTGKPKKQEMNDQLDREPVFIAKSPKDLSQFSFTGGDPSGTGLEWENARGWYMSGGTQTTPKGNNPPKKFN